MKINHDNMFKYLIRYFFQDYLEFTQPEVAETIDFTHVVDRSEYLSPLTNEIRHGLGHVADVVLETKLKDTGEPWVFHIEAQASSQGSFLNRMHIYYALCVDNFQCEVESHAICFNISQINRPNIHKSNNKTKSKFKAYFEYVKIDLDSYDVNDFRHSQNPFVIACLGLMNGVEKMSLVEKVELKVDVYLNLFSLDYNVSDEKAAKKEDIITLFIETYMSMDNLYAHDMFIEKLFELGVENKKFEVKIMNLMNNDWYQDGVKKGEEKKNKEWIKLIINEFDMDDEKIAQYSKTTVEYVQQVRRELELNKSDK
ncbi:Rpn family recombination-promoting nuclease/putative transposase [Bacillus cereus]|uniref:Transposase n=1 Tax=Bacillus cereus TaxID=1396 RepID=A0A162NWI9_BACCE|nr:hypothetical protein [Bacillus cereus]KZD55703.1 hypothetical protein B4088_5448 [Bacillus cereus]